MRALRTYLVAALVACVLTAASARAEADPAATVPKDVMVYVEAQKAEVDGLLAMAATMPVMRLLSSTLHMPAMQTRFGLVEQLLHLAPGSFDPAAPHVSKAAFILWDKEPLGVLSFDEAGWAEKLTASLTEEGGALVHGTDLVFGSQAGCEAIARGGYEPLAKSADFQAARATAGTAALWAYVDVPALLKALNAEDSPQAAQVNAVLSLIGLDTVPYAVVAVQGKGPAGGATLTLRLAENQGGVLGLLPQGAPQMPALVPAGCSASLVLNWGDAAAFLEGLKKLRVGPAGEQAPTLGDQLAMMAQLYGISLDKLAAQLGSGAAVYLPAPGADGALSYGDLTIVLHLKDAAGFRATLDGIVKGVMHQALTPAMFDGTELLQLMLPPAYMKFMDDRLVIGATPAAVNRYLKAQFPAAATGQPAEAEPAGAVVARFDLGLLTTSYPKPESGIKLFLALSREGRDLKLSLSYRDLTPSSVARAYMAYPAIMATMFMSTWWERRVEVQEPTVRRSVVLQSGPGGTGSLSTIGFAIAMYRAENKDQFPPDLEVLVEGAYLAGPNLFVDPADKDPQVRGPKGYRYSYEYAGPLPAQTPPKFIVAYSRKGIRPNGRERLTVDNSLGFITEEALHQSGGGQGPSFRQQYDWLMENYGTTFTDEQKAGFRKFYEVDAAPVAPKPAQ